MLRKTIAQLPIVVLAVCLLPMLSFEDGDMFHVHITLVLYVVDSYTMQLRLSYQRLIGLHASPQQIEFTVPCACKHCICNSVLSRSYSAQSNLRSLCISITHGLDLIITLLAKVHVIN